MKNITPCIQDAPLVWTFNDKDGCWYSQGYWSGHYRIQSIRHGYVNHGEGESFEILNCFLAGRERLIGCVRELAAAKQICELLENA